MHVVHVNKLKILFFIFSSLRNQTKEISISLPFSSLFLSLTPYPFSFPSLSPFVTIHIISVGVIRVGKLHSTWILFLYIRMNISPLNSYLAFCLIYGSNKVLSSCSYVILYISILLSWWSNVFWFTGNVLQAAFWYGLVVHFRIYPIIYALPIILVLDPHIFQSGQKPVLSYWTAGQGKTTQSSTDVTYHCTMWTVLRKIFTRHRIMFGLVSGIVFLSFTGFFFYLYGRAFLHEALLYHLTRTDPRHNFSMYFYHIYLHYEQEISVVEKLISFLPQFMVQLVLIFCFAQDLPFCFFVQTVAFVAFNKVC